VLPGSTPPRGQRERERGRAAPRGAPARGEPAAERQPQQLQRLRVHDRRAHAPCECRGHGPSGQPRPKALLRREGHVTAERLFLRTKPA